MAEQKIESRDMHGVIDESHPAWKQGPYTQTPTPVGIVKYNGKGLDPKSAPNRLVCYETTDKLGSGSFGTVYEAGAYQINYELKKLTYKKNKVVKVTTRVDDEAKETILAEYAQGKKTPHLGMKAPVFSGPDGNQTCYIVMNRLPGKELLDLLRDGTIEKLSVDKKLELTHKLLLALRDQVTRQGIVHRDLKAENVMVQLEPEIQVNIIDYGLAKAQNTDDGNSCGTPAYTAPEIFEFKSHGSACDVFSMAKVIALLWIDDKSLYNQKKQSLDQWLEFALNSAQIIEQNASEDLKSKANLLQLLKLMLNPCQDERISIDKAIAFFEKSYPEFKRSKEQESIDNILIHLSNLKRYANKIKNTHPTDSRTINQFTKEMQNIIKAETKSIQDIKQECSSKLSDPKIIKCAENHKYAQYVLKNIAAAILGLGVIYGIACGINKLVTGRATFFHKNEINNAYHHIKNEFESIAVGAPTA